MLYRVGGYVRDSIMGLEPTDIDYVFVQEGATFEDLREFLLASGYTIILASPEYLTIRAKDSRTREVIDFSLPRKDVAYSSDSRRPQTAAASLYEDLARRDYTANAIAEGSDGTLIDPFQGVGAIHARILDTPSDPLTTFMDDPLRVLRGFRFCITHGFRFADRILPHLANPQVWGKLRRCVSAERIRTELEKCFKFSTISTMLFLSEHCTRDMMTILFENIVLKPAISTVKCKSTYREVPILRTLREARSLIGTSSLTS